MLLGMEDLAKEREGCRLIQNTTTLTTEQAEFIGAQMHTATN